MNIKSVEFDTLVPMQALFACDMRSMGVPLLIGFKTCGDHWHIGVMKFDAQGEAHPVDVDGGDEPEKFASPADCVAALAQIVEDEQTGIVLDEIPFNVVVNVDESALKAMMFNAFDGRDHFGGMADFMPPANPLVN